MKRVFYFIAVAWMVASMLSCNKEPPIQSQDEEQTYTVTSVSTKALFNYE